MGLNETLAADRERKESPNLGEILETAAPLALSAYILDRCIVSPFVVLPCSNRWCTRGPYTYQLLVPLPRVRTIRPFGYAVVSVLGGIAPSFPSEISYRRYRLSRSAKNVTAKGGTRSDARTVRA